MALSKQVIENLKLHVTFFIKHLGSYVPFCHLKMV
jgi:hypothetical protein